MNTQLVCVLCGESASSFFIVVGSKAICTKCKESRKSNRQSQFQKPRVFTRYICKTHNCKTYSACNMYFRHMMKTCVIVTQETLGIIRPSTEGGVNGDISRRYFLGLNEMDRLKTNLGNYKRFMTIKLKLDGRRTSYTSRKFYAKHTGFLRKPLHPDYHRYDEAFKKLKFNLNNYIESLPKRIRKPMLTQEERNKLYYKQLMETLQVQIAQ